MQDSLDFMAALLPALDQAVAAARAAERPDAAADQAAAAAQG